MSVRLAIISETKGKKRMPWRTAVICDARFYFLSLIDSTGLRGEKCFSLLREYIYYQTGNNKLFSKLKKIYYMLLFSLHPEILLSIRKELKILVNPYNYAVLVIVNPKKYQSSKLFTLSRQVTWLMTSTYVALEEYLMLRTCTEKQAWTETFGRVGSDKEFNSS